MEISVFLLLFKAGIGAWNLWFPIFKREVERASEKVERVADFQGRFNDQRSSRNHP